MGVFIEYVVTFHDPCLDVTPSIDATILAEADLNYDYELFQGDYTETLDDSKVTSTEVTTTCPAFQSLELMCYDSSTSNYDACSSDADFSRYFSLSGIPP